MWDGSGWKRAPRKGIRARWCVCTLISSTRRKPAPRGITTMREYQPQWMRLKNFEKTPSLATDRTDTLLAQSETVSSVSGDLGANREIFPPEPPDPAAMV